MTVKGKTSYNSLDVIRDWLMVAMLAIVFWIASRGLSWIFTPPQLTSASYDYAVRHHTRYADGGWY